MLVLAPLDVVAELEVERARWYGWARGVLVERDEWARGAGESEGVREVEVVREDEGELARGRGRKAGAGRPAGAEVALFQVSVALRRSLKLG